MSTKFLYGSEWRFRSSDWSTPSAFPTTTIIDGQGVQCEIWIDRATSAVLANLTIQNGNSGAGSGIYASSIENVLILVDTLIMNNTASDRGGGQCGAL